MKKYLVIGNPIEHSLSPKLHNHWIKNNNINAIYEKQKLNEDDIESVILKVKEKKIQGINVTVPFKKIVIPFLDQLSSEAENTQSVNTIYLDNNKVFGHNTDIGRI
jgi:shikimate dehydrogenase